MTDIFKTLIIPIEDALFATNLAASMDPANYSGMFQTPLGLTSNGPITHYVSSGYINSEWLTEFTAQCPTLLIFDEEPFSVFAELSVVIVDQSPDIHDE